MSRKTEENHEVVFEVQLKLTVPAATKLEARDLIFSLLKKGSSKSGVLLLATNDGDMEFGCEIVRKTE
jgi:hypothetical protein